MTDPSPANPFRQLGSPPEGDDPEAFLAYLRGIIDAFEQVDQPRMQPIKQKWYAAMDRFTKATNSGLPAEQIAEDLKADMTALRIDVYSLLLTLLNQLRGTLKVKMHRIPAAQRADTERMLEGMGMFAQGLRKVLKADKNQGTPTTRAEGQALIEKGAAALESIQLA